MQTDFLRKQILAAAGEARAELVLKNAGVVNVFTGEVEQADVAIQAGQIVGLGRYEGETERDLSGKYLCPGLIDGHIHIESSMLCGPAFAQAVLPHGTTAVVTDPHEIANVAGLAGLDFMLETTEGLDLSVYFMLPSCVPATGLDESGAELAAADLAPYYAHPRVLGLAEMMNSYGTVRAEEGILQKLCGSLGCGKRVDGHAPFLSGKALNAYVTAGVGSDHECSALDEALEKLRRGQYIMIREGTAAQNLAALLPLFRPPYCERCMLVTDDRHPGDLLRGGHIDAILRKAVAAGADPVTAVRMATLIPARYFGLAGQGAVAPSYAADLVVLSDLQSFAVESVYKAGRLVAAQGRQLAPRVPALDEARYAPVLDSFHLPPVRPEDLALRESGRTQRVIWLTPRQLLTTERLVPFATCPGCAPGVDPARQIVKLAVLERHHGSGHIGLGFLGGYGLQRGAVASSIAHDSHNLILAGTNDTDMALAANTVRKNRGGLAFALDGRVVGELALPVAGLMSPGDAWQVEQKLRALKAALRCHGIPEEIDPFMTLAFVSLPVIPKLRLNTCGVVDVDTQQLLPAVF